jgi:hypothetical protein
VGKTGELLKELSQNNFRERFEGWKAGMERCVASNLNCSEGDKCIYNNSIYKITLWE